MIDETVIPRRSASLSTCVAISAGTLAESGTRSGTFSALAPGDAGIAHLVAAFRQGLSETGYVEGRNVAIEYRWAEGQYDRLPAMVSELLRRHVAVIAAVSTPSALAQQDDRLLLRRSCSDQIADYTHLGAALQGD
jgi:hypothetical protein